MTQQMKIVERSQISPPPGSVPATTLPLTFLDYVWFFCRTIQRLFFFQPPHPFTQTTLAALKSSLSLTLRFFFPLAAKLCIPPPPLQPHMIYTEGDSVPLTFAESSADFNRITSHNPLPCEELYDLMPQLPPAAQESGDGTPVASVLAAQVTLFPDSGICIAIAFNHVVVDGRSINHFVKSWGSVFRGDLGSVERSPPFCDRNAIRDEEATGIETILLKEWWDRGLEPVSNWTKRDYSGKVRVTLVIDEGAIKKLKHWFAGLYNEDLQISGFTAISAVVWKCLMKSQEKRNERKEVCHLLFFADCRSRAEFNIPDNYFGNCLAVLIASIKISDLVGEKGLEVAARAIAGAVKELGKGRVREEGRRSVSKWREAVSSGEVVGVAGSPRLRAYETDFGWGKATRTETAHVYPRTSFYFGEARDEEDAGCEIALALHPTEMEAFNAYFHQALNVAPH